MVTGGMSGRPDRAKEFVKLIERFRYEHNLYDVFRDWTEAAAASLHQAPYHAELCRPDEDFERVEADYMEAVKRYNKPELDVFAEMLGVTLIALREEKHDFLGRCFMQLNLGNEYIGQFFTPYEVSLLIARLGSGDFSGTIQAQGFMRVLEPACGSGGMVIALAQTIEEKQLNASRAMWFEAVDVDRKCANMTYIQTAALGLMGLVVHGNSLRMEITGCRFTPAARANPALANRMMEAGQSESLALVVEPTGQIQIPFER